MTSAPATVRIHPPTVEDRGDWVRVRFPVEGLARDALWFDVSAEFGHFIDTGCDAAATALLPAAMLRRRDMHVTGPISERLLWGLRDVAMPLTRRIRPSLGAIHISADAPGIPDRAPGSAVLTGLSCGVDSFSLLVDHLLDKTQLPGYCVTHLVFAHIGHHGYGRDVQGRVEHRWQGIRAAAGELGVPILRVYSNMPDFYPPEYDHELNWAAVLTIRNAAVPLLLQEQVRRFLFASSHTWSSLRVEEGRIITELDPAVLPALSTERIDLVPVGTDHTRVYKTERIANLDIAQRHLDVCIMEGPNCSACKKCLRTLLTLEVLGCVDAFGQVFDLDVYRRHRARYMAETLVQVEDAYQLEIRDLMRDRHFGPPGKVQTMAAVLGAWRRLPGPVKTTLRMVRRGIARR